MAFQNIGTAQLGTIGAAGKACVMDAAAIASGQAFLTSELEKRDMIIRTPLTSFTYSRDLPIRVGGGWVDYTSAMNVEFGVTGGSGDGIVGAGGSDGLPTITANFGKGLWKAHNVSFAARVLWIDMQKGNMTGRNLDTFMRDGARMTYDKHLDQNAYAGFATFGTTGLVNNAGVTVTAATGNFNALTPDQILADINGAITRAWAAAGYDKAAIPNHIIMPYEQYNYIATTKVSNLAEKTILKFLLENNIAAQNGEDLYIGGTAWCKGAGAGSTDRMVVYCNKERFIAMDELVPLTRAMTSNSAATFSYDTAFAGNISEVETFYLQTIQYVDGI